MSQTLIITGATGDIPLSSPNVVAFTDIEGTAKARLPITSVSFSKTLNSPVEYTYVVDFSDGRVWQQILTLDQLLDPQVNFTLTGAFRDWEATLMYQIRAAIMVLVYQNQLTVLSLTYS